MIYLPVPVAQLQFAQLSQSVFSLGVLVVFALTVALCALAVRK